LAKSREVEEAMRGYEEKSILPNPEEFGLGVFPSFQ